MMDEVAIKSVQQIVGASPSEYRLHRVNEWKILSAIADTKAKCASECNNVSKTNFKKAYKKKRYNELYEARDNRVDELKKMLSGEEDEK